VTNAVAGVVTTFTVTLFDDGNNQRETGGDTLVIKIDNGVIQDIETFDNDDGTYTVQYKILDASTTHQLLVEINGDAPNAKTSVITVVPNSPVSALSTLTAATLIDLESAYTVNVSVFDNFANAVTLVQPIV